MGRSLSSAKKKGLEPVSDRGGVVAALAIDQHGAMREPFGKAMVIAPEDRPAEKLVPYQEAVSGPLIQHASAIRLDAEFRLLAANERASGTGPLLAYENTGCDKKVPGRLPSLLVHRSRQRLVKAGVDCVKLLLYYSSMSSEEINNQKHALVKRVGAECMAGWQGTDTPR